MHMKPVFGVLLLLGLAACAEAMPGPARPAGVPADAVATTVEPNGKFLRVVGPLAQHSDPFLGVPNTNYDGLRSLIDRRTGETAHQLYVEDSYLGAKREWNAAESAKGQKLKFIPISVNEITCDGGRCAYAEEFAAAIPEADLRANPNGFTVFFSSKSGNQMAIPIPGTSIAKQLSAVETARSSLLASSAAPAAAAAASAPAAASGPGKATR